jgi:hypothetical protein
MSKAIQDAQNAESSSKKLELTATERAHGDVPAGILKLMREEMGDGSPYAVGSAEDAVMGSSET